MTSPSSYSRISLALGALFCLVASPVDAGRKPEDIFRGQIITSKKRIPTSASSAAAYVRKLRKLRTKRFQENKAKKEWKIYFAAFFKRPLNDFEVTIKLFDTTTKPARMLSSFEQYLSDKGLRTFSSKLVLERKFYGVNKNILMKIESRGKTLAKTTFKILGEATRYKGSVDFTKDE